MPEETSGNLKLRPGFLVNLSTAVRGGVSIKRKVTREEMVGNEEVREWETEKRTLNPAEHQEAVTLRVSVRDAVRRICIETPFGLICPKEKISELDSVLNEKAIEVEQFNNRSDIYTVRFASMRGEIADSEAEAIQAVRAEVGGLLSDLEEATRLGQVKDARDLARRATQMSKLIEDETEANEKLSRAVKAARRVASQVAKRVEKGAENLADVLEEQQMGEIAEARFAFIGENPGVARATEEHEEPDTPTTRFADLAE